MADLKGKNVLKVTAKGQVTLRKDVLAHLGVGPGDKILFETLADGRVEMKKSVQKTGKWSDIAGMLKQENGPVLTIEEMNEIIEKGWAGEL
jgi:bifunctional DNA-binding transcriptional regulator/antitoxin component of YhaV-PrlF toxin-antitoxin module